MPIELKPETERLVEEEMRNGHFHSVAELIVEGVQAWRRQHGEQPSVEPERPKKTLYEFFRESPLVGLELEFERDKDTARDIEL